MTRVFRSLTAIPGGLEPGRLVSVKGVVPENCSRFVINLQKGDSLHQDDDIALHISVRFDEDPNTVVRNSKVDGEFGEEERGGFFPFREGHGFEIQIHCGHDAYQIAVNGHHVFEYGHRISHQHVDHVTVLGNIDAPAVHFSNERICGHNGPHYFDPDNEPSDPFLRPLPVSPLVTIPYPGFPSINHIPGGVRPGRLIRICATPLEDIVRLVINLQNGEGPDNIPFHISIRFDERPKVVVRNTKVDGAWGDEERDGDFPFDELEKFEALILIERDEYKVAINGRHFTCYGHRVPFEDITHLRLKSDGGALCSLVQFDYVNSHHHGYHH